MNIKRILTTIIGLPIVIAVFCLNNFIIVDCLISIVAIISIYEFKKCAKNKNIKIISWIGYIYAILIAIKDLVNINMEHILYSSIVSIVILFLHIILTEGEITFEDIAHTIFGIIYIVGFSVFIPIIYSLKEGNLYIWFVFITAWGTDTFAYLCGKYLGKHKFNKISPNKTIEGCIGGILGAVAILMVYSICLNTFFGFCLEYMQVIGMAIILSIIGQIGDFSASAIKRYFEVKDFGKLFPGHGGMIDRIDSVILIAPFAYFFIINIL